MKLTSVEIVNFRSIDSLSIEFNPKCRVLVGINESGKSNILRALSFLMPEKIPTKDDLREPLPTEQPIEEAYVDFNFELTLEEIGKIYDIILKKVYTDKPKKPIIFKDKVSFDLQDFTKSRNKGVYSINIIDKSKTTTYWGLNNSYKIAPGWKKPTDMCPPDYFTTLQTGEKVTLKNYSLIDESICADVQKEYLADIDAKYVNDIVGSETGKFIGSNIPKTLFWLYDENNLLPPSIGMTAFSANPEICQPLKNMFLLAGYLDIGKSINDAKQGSRNSLLNLLNNVAHKTTLHFHNVWKEYKKIEFDLIPDGDNIIPSIKEKNRYDCSKRSDGFKRFISFLLMISANVKTGLLVDTLLLIDEPDTSLHPSGARYLREELIKISNKNYVVYSTHSIFMIDRENISRHIIVKKEDEKTMIENVNESNIIDEEVIYNALGYSIFESLQKKNIIFEGWKDKKLFQIAITKNAQLKKAFKNVGFCHAKGVTHIKTVASTLELANRDCLIISDADEPARRLEKEYIDVVRGFGIWKRYDEINANIKAITGEDFIKKDIVLKHLQTIKDQYTNLTDLTSLNLSDSKGCLFVIKEWLKKGGKTDIEIKSIVDGVKNDLFENLKVTEIEDAYFEMINSMITLSK